MNSVDSAGVFKPLEGDDPTTVAGYRLSAKLGSGGMGKVYLSYTLGGRAVAIKVIRPEFSEDAEFRRRFRQEVKAAQRVQGLYTAPVIDSDPDGPTPWLATAYVPGPSLAESVAQHGKLPVSTVLFLVAGIAEALQVIHGAGIVHRDLKPSNVLLADDGPRVIDFGIARAADATSLTSSGVTVGTPTFMAPEQAAGREVTPATDIFALGQVAAYAAIGTPAFGEGTSHGVLYRIVHEEPDLTGLPAELSDLVGRCLRKDPAARPALAEILQLCQQASPHTQLRRSEDWLPGAVAADITGRVPAPAPRQVPAPPQVAPAAAAPAPAAPPVPPAPQQAPSPAYPAHAPQTPAAPPAAPPAQPPTPAQPPAAAPAAATAQPTAAPAPAPQATPTPTPAHTPPPVQAANPAYTPNPAQPANPVQTPPPVAAQHQYGYPQGQGAAVPPQQYGYPQQQAGAHQAYGYPQSGDAAGQGGYGPPAFSTTALHTPATGSDGAGPGSTGTTVLGSPEGGGAGPRKRGRGKLVALGVTVLLVFAAAGGVTTYVLLKDDDKKSHQAEKKEPSKAAETRTQAPTTDEPSTEPSDEPSETPSETVPTVVPDPEPVTKNGINLPEGYHLFFASDPIEPENGSTDSDIAYRNTFGDRELSTSSPDTKLVLLNNAQEGTLETCRAETRFATSIGFDRLSKGSRICVRTGSGHIGLVTFNGLAPESDPSDYVKLDVTVWRNALDVAVENDS
ncbi:serine/threonine-protein kinase [Streptomyces sp. 71268]|uniref:serine/threonine-protein kinase n=1 Tax=Streptomyces sp. 71268 TaxID=3002640 RepID=UPI0023F872DA|nr:serine/threonine-protein kinase [Streptomyces sp. 71268]WEV24735.1 serine/threonine-protein kinase [Streptomyces sp. 71268]